MFEITQKDKSKFRSLVKESKVYENSIYDFTFENRFIIYHTNVIGKNRYIALDKKTGYSSRIFDINANECIKEINYPELIPYILFSIKYTGDIRYEYNTKVNPEILIDFIFKSILTQYGYKVREEQIDLCKSMFYGFQNRKISICEAEVGTGKTLAYLIAAVLVKCSSLRFEETGFPITIATSNIELQKSLTERDIPELSRILYSCGFIKKPINVVLRKGKEHYFCYKRYLDFISQKRYKPERKEYIAILNELKKTEFSQNAFDLDLYDYHPYIKDRICVKGGCCNQCKYREGCKYFQFEKQAITNPEIDFQITNHNQFIMDMKKRSEQGIPILRTSDFIIIDEAHKFMEAAESVFGSTVNYDVLESYLNSIKYCSSTKNYSERKKVIDSIVKLSDMLFGHLNKRFDENDEESIRLLIRLRNVEKGIIGKIISKLNDLQTFLKHDEPSTAFLIRLYEYFLKDDSLVWLEKNEKGTISLNAVSKNLGLYLYKTVWKNNLHFVLTSGTISDGVNFDYFKKENGISVLSKNQTLTLIKSSPFDYQNNTRLYIPDKLPSPHFDNTQDEQSYYQQIADNIVDIVDATNGHTAILFTSYKALKTVFNLTHERLNQYELICMGEKDKLSISKFKQSKNAVLFASGSMWEGVDVPGDTLSSVIIVKLPFPLRDASKEDKKSEYDDLNEFIEEVAVPNMIIKLRQGIGRLIRNETDTGLISILDSRVKNSVYAPKIEKAISRYPKVNSLDEISDFFHSVKNEEYFSK